MNEFKFSNFQMTPITIDGIVWPSVEHYYQAMKSEDPIEQSKIRKREFVRALLAENLPTKVFDWNFSIDNQYQFKFYDSEFIIERSLHLFIYFHDEENNVEFYFQPNYATTNNYLKDPSLGNIDRYFDPDLQKNTIQKLMFLITKLVLTGEYSYTEIVNTLLKEN